MKKHITRYLLIGIGLMLAIQAQTKAEGHLVFIANKGMPIKEVSEDLIKDIFIGKAKFVQDGIKPTIGLREESELHDQLCRSYYSLTPTEMKKNWARRIFAGSNIAPSSIHGDDAEAKKWIQANPNGITYILEQNLDETVKKITIKKD